jgi:hypothetical protein
MSQCANLDFYIRPNPNPGVSLSFSDVKVVLPLPVTRVILVSKLSGANLYLHQFPLHKIASGNQIPVDGTEEWIPLANANGTSFPALKFCTANDTFYLSGDGGGTNPADFSLLFTNEVDNIDAENEQPATDIPNPLPVSGPLTDAQLGARLPLSVTGPLTDAQLGVRLPLSVTGPLTDAQLGVRLPLSVTGPLTDAQLGVRLPLQTDLRKVNGVAVSSPLADAPDGSETAQVVRTIGLKRTITETITPLGAGATFTGNWHDSELTGNSFVMVTSRGDTAMTLQIQESNDSSDANQTLDTIFNPSTWQYGAATIAANTTRRTSVIIRARYWRVIVNNTGALQTSLKVISCAMNAPSDQFNLDLNSTTVYGPSKLTPVCSTGSASAIGEGGVNDTSLATINTGVMSPWASAMWVFNGSAAGTSVAGRRYSKARNPNVIKTGQFTTGTTALWTPSAGNFYRLLKFIVEVTDNATLAVGGVLTITFNETTTGDLPIAFDVFVPAVALNNSGILYSSGWIELGFYGVLAAAVNRALNVKLSAALATGNVRVTVAGCEE